MTSASVELRRASEVRTDPNRRPDRDVGVDIANVLAAMVYEDLPEAVVEATKQSLLDTIAVMLAGSGFSDNVAKMVDVFAEGQAGAGSTIVGYGVCAPAWTAAFINGAMSHALDYDDCYQELAIHPSGPSVPAALAVAERKGGVSGKQLITAVAASSDFSYRLGRAIGVKLNWYRTPLIGFFTSTLAAGRVLDLGADELFHALGIAFCQAGGTSESRRGTGSSLAEISNGWPNHAGVISALMAQKGVGGVPGVFEGELGFFNMFSGGLYRREELVDGLGRKFSGDISFRPWPACGSAHPSIDATLHLVEGNNIAVDDIKAIDVRLGDETDWRLCQPLEFRRRPKNVMDSRYSIPFQVAVAAVHRSVKLAHFAPAGISDPVVLETASKVTPIWDPSMQNYTPGIAGSHSVTIRTHSGATYTHRTDIPYGRHPNSLNWGALEAKLRDCAGAAVRPMSNAQTDRLIETVRDLEKCADIATLVDCLAYR
jgi:2-methylcitrate dehydratase PrpD